MRFRGPYVRERVCAVQGPLRERAGVCGSGAPYVRERVCAVQGPLRERAGVCGSGAPT